MSDINKLQELINIARQKPAKEEDDFEDPKVSEINSFIQAKGMNTSNKLIPARIIYDEFKAFSNIKMTKQIFFNIFNRLFERKKVMGLVCYAVTPVSVGLPPEYSVYKDPRFSKKAKKLKESKYVGVYPDIAGGFVARLKTEHGSRLIGHFYNEKEAAKEYDKYAKMAFGDQAVLNFGDSNE